MTGKHRKTKEGAKVPKDLKKRVPGKALKDREAKNSEPKGPAAHAAAKKAAADAREWSLLKPKPKNK